MLKKAYKYFCFRSNYSPFSHDPCETELEKLGFVRSSPRRADLIIARNVKMARIACIQFPFKKVIVWTNEPFYDLSSTDKSLFLFKKIYIFNVYTGNVFLNNISFLGVYHYMEECDLGLPLNDLIDVDCIATQEDFEIRKLAIGVFERKPKFFRRPAGNSQIDLSVYRQTLAEDGWRRGLCDIAGRGWQFQTLEDSANGSCSSTPWWTRKIELMAGYRFNLAFENTNWPYYVTEKIWQSIKAGCLPVSWGNGSSLYETFPRESFVDASDLLTVKDLWDKLEIMSYEEWRNRMRRCVEAYNFNLEASRLSKGGNLAALMKKVSDVLDA